MRLLDYMTPARSLEEAAMTAAKIHTLSGGAALSSLRVTGDIAAEDVKEKVPAAMEEKKESHLPRRRAALRHVLERQF